MVQGKYQKWPCVIDPLLDTLIGGETRRAPSFSHRRTVSEGATVKQRFNYAKAAPGVYDAMDALDRYLLGADWSDRCSC